MPILKDDDRRSGGAMASACCSSERAWERCDSREDSMRVIARLRCRRSPHELAGPTRREGDIAREM